jgi:iron complex transport system substrate-binding protein
MRIVSLLASATETICELGLGECLVGRSHECDNPHWVRELPACTSPAFDTHMSSGDIDREVRRRMKAREPLYHLDYELMSRLKPDLLIAQAHCEVCAVTPADVKRSAALAGTEVLALQAGNLEGIFEDIGRIAETLGRVDEGEQLIARLRLRLNRLESELANRRKPSVVMLEWTDPVFPMSNWGPELVDVAHGDLLLGKPGEYSRAIDWSDVRNADPEYLIVAPCGYSLKRTLEDLPVLNDYPGWQELRAVRERKVVFADGNLYFNRSGITVVDTAEMIADILHGTSYYTAPDDAAYCQALST